MVTSKKLLCGLSNKNYNSIYFYPLLCVKLFVACRCLITSIKITYFIRRQHGNSNICCVYRKEVSLPGYLCWSPGNLPLLFVLNCHSVIAIDNNQQLKSFTVDILLTYVINLGNIWPSCHLSFDVGHEVFRKAANLLLAIGDKVGINYCWYPSNRKYSLEMTNMPV